MYISPTGTSSPKNIRFFISTRRNITWSVFIPIEAILESNNIEIKQTSTHKRQLFICPVRVEDRCLCMQKSGNHVNI